MTQKHSFHWSVLIIEFVCKINALVVHVNVFKKEMYSHFKTPPILQHMDIIHFCLLINREASGAIHVYKFSKINFSTSRHRRKRQKTTERSLQHQSYCLYESLEIIPARINHQ